MKKIKSIKYRVLLSYTYSFVFDLFEDACSFIRKAIIYSEDKGYIERFDLAPIVEYEEEIEPIYCDTDSLKEADKMKIKQQLNEEFGVASSDKEENKDAEQNFN